MGNRRTVPPDQVSEIIGTVEAAKLLGYSRDHVTRLCQAGKIPATKAIGEWRIRRAAIVALLPPEGGE